MSYFAIRNWCICFQGIQEKFSSSHYENVVGMDISIDPKVQIQFITVGLVGYPMKIVPISVKSTKRSNVLKKALAKANFYTFIPFIHLMTPFWKEKSCLYSLTYFIKVALNYYYNPNRYTILHSSVTKQIFKVDNMAHFILFFFP